MKNMNPWQGFVLGTIGGIGGILAMRAYWRAATEAAGGDPRNQTSAEDIPDTDVLDDVSLIGQHHKQGESSTAALGRIIYEQITGESPDEKTKTALSYIIHWMLSMGVSGLYGAARGRATFPDVLGGLLIGIGLWGLGDELLMPLVGLTKGPTAYPPELHAHGLGAHLAYGLGCSATTQALYALSRG